MIENVKQLKLNIRTDFIKKEKGVNTINCELSVATVQILGVN